jgi:CelD/BcsL family acetyltransferase involved in cellulose biosynthesis
LAVLWPIGWLERLVRELLETRAPGCAGTLSVLSAGDRPVAIHFGLRSAATLAC